ncbi:hypothetical protein DL96DRAFT_1626001 [Flagelloscypha sp. PMI_526]|nr:hypothetical protein DL96DRAFT_1626001 [Flagelloscypha sp. PMI_526]
MSRFVHYTAPASGSSSSRPDKSMGPIGTSISPSQTLLNPIPIASPVLAHSRPSPTPTPTPGSGGTRTASTSTNGKGKSPTNSSMMNPEWMTELVKLAKTAELKKHALTLQLATSHLISVHSAADEQQKAIEDSKAEKNRLESERVRLLECLAQVNTDRDKADLLLADLQSRQTQTRFQITTLTSPESQYATSKKEVDRLRRDLGESPLPPLQKVLEERLGRYLTERRLNGNVAINGAKRAAPTAELDGAPVAKRGRGRPKKKQDGEGSSS